MTPLLHARKPNPHPDAPKLVSLSPPAAMPGGEVELRGTGMQARGADVLPQVTVADTPAYLSLSRPSRAVIRIPDGTISGDVLLSLPNGARPSVSNALELRVAVPMAEGLHPVANPAVDADGNVYATFSGSRGQAVPVSIFSVARDFQLRPFVRDLLNPSGLAFDANGYLYASSRAEGTVYRISPAGAITTYAEGMGIATGIAFDRDGNLFVGDRSGTIFKIIPSATPGEQPGSALNPHNPNRSGEIFVFATLEPSTAFYHLCFRPDGVLMVTTPTISSHQSIYAIDPYGNTTVYYRGLGRPQGMAFDIDGNLYVAASLRGHRGIVRLRDTPNSAAPEAELIVAGNDLIGLCFLDDGCCALATNSTIFHADLGIEGHPLI